jgi:D-glycero-D-manno-heptose 1,7-bisphosphate phosphatase
VPDSHPAGSAPRLRPAVFLDRDGTLVDDPGYLGNPADVRLLPGAARAVADFGRAGFATIVVTNQGGLAKGLFTLEAYRSVERRVAELVEAEGGRLDAVYFCPHHPDLSGPCDCRKPGLELYRRAIREEGIDPVRSWWIGDRLTDLQPSRALGGRGLLVRTGHGRENAAQAAAEGFETAEDLREGLRRILELTATR